MNLVEEKVILELQQSDRLELDNKKDLIRNEE